MSQMEITVAPDKAVEPVPAAPASSSEALLVVIARASSDPNVDVDKMRELLDMQERIMGRQAEMAFTEAMNRVQERVPRLVKDRKIIVKGSLRSKYAALEDIDKVLRPLILSEGFSLKYDSEDVPPKNTRMILWVKHRMGHKESTSLVLPLDNSDFRSAAQNAASTVSFGRRILLCMAFNLITVDEDKDGNPPGDLISQDQVLNVIDALKRCGLKENDARFLAWVGADSVEHIEAGSYTRAMAELNKRAGARQQ